MKEIQGELILVRVSEGASARESTVSIKGFHFNKKVYPKDWLVYDVLWFWPTNEQL